MKILVDTCVWSLALRRKSRTMLSSAEQGLVTQLTNAIRDGNVAIIGPIRQEVLSGIKNEDQFKRIAELLAPFPDMEIRQDDYVSAARSFNLCRNHGMQCGPVDMLICSLAAQRHWTILTNDHGLLRCVNLLQRTSGGPRSA